jgi:AraC family transcriptional regulator
MTMTGHQPVHVREAQLDPQMIRAALALPGVSIELCDFPEILPEHLVVTESWSVLSLGLSPLLAGSEGRYGPHTRFARFGSLSFRPAGVPSEMRFSGGAFETIRCRFDALHLPKAISGVQLGEAQLEACFDIRVQAIETAMLRLAEELAHPSPDTKALAAALIATILIDLARYLAGAARLAERRTGGLARHQMRRVQERMDRGGRPASVDELAALCGLSRFHFMRSFRATTGQSPGAFVQAARIARAKAMLAAGRPSVEIASTIGFNSISAFSTAFRRAVGRSPTAYRQAIRS